MEKHTLNNKTAIVTGGASGIGLATARLLASHGANVVIADMNRSAGITETNAISSLGHKCIFVETDVRIPQQVKCLVDRTVESFNSADILFNNAGVEIHATIHEMSEEDWNAVIDTNLKGAFLCSKYTIPHMVRRGNGVIINNSSLMAHLTLPGYGAYSASKAGLIGLTKAMALDLATYGIRVNIISPGSIDTPHMWIGVETSELNAIKVACAETQPFGRIGKSDEIAKVVLFLASEDASYITGSEISVDGGLGARIATSR